MRPTIFLASAIWSALALAACGTTQRPEPEIRTVEVRVPVAVSCVPEGTPTETPARADVSGETGSVIQAITAELIRWRGYGAQVAPVVAACLRAGEPPTEPATQ